MSLIGSIISTVVEAVVSPIIETVTDVDITEKLKESKKAGDDTATQEQIAKEMGDIKMLCALDKEDRFIKQTEREDKLRAEKEKAAENEKAKVGAQIEKFESQANLSTESLINQVQESNLISNDKFIAFQDFVEDLLSDTKSNTSVVESMKTFTSKLSEVEEHLQKYKSELKLTENNEESVFGLNTKRDNYEKDNPIETNTANKEDSKQKTFVA